MMPAMGRWAWPFAVGLLALTALVGCGSRTGLDAPGASGTPGIKPGQPYVPYTSDCPDGGTNVYVLTEDSVISSFAPASATFTAVGLLDCRSAGIPFSMAVDRKGTAYVEFQVGSVGELFKVDLAGPTCSPTSFRPEQQMFETFGMGFSTDQGGPAETLYVAASGPGGAHALGTIDPTTFVLTEVAQLPGALVQPELTGTGDGRLFAFSSDSPNGSGSFVAQIDKTTAAILARTDLPQVTQGHAWAFAFWGGDFYLFTSAPCPAINCTSQVTRLRPSDGSVTVVATLSSSIVGAGVSTCAPASSP